MLDARRGGARAPRVPAWDGASPAKRAREAQAAPESPLLSPEEIAAVPQRAPGDAAAAWQTVRQRAVRGRMLWILVAALALGCLNQAFGLVAPRVAAAQERRQLEAAAQAIHHAQDAFFRRAGFYAGAPEALSATLDPQVRGSLRLLTPRGGGYWAEACRGSRCVLVNERGDMWFADASAPAEAP